MHGRPNYHGAFIDWIAGRTQIVSRGQVILILTAKSLCLEAAGAAKDAGIADARRCAVSRHILVPTNGRLTGPLCRYSQRCETG
jgi:hypothetical protein